MWHKYVRIRVIDPLVLPFWTLVLIVDRFRFMEKYDIDRVVFLLAVARASETDFRVVNEPNLF